MKMLKTDSTLPNMRYGPTVHMRRHCKDILPEKANFFACKKGLLIKLPCIKYMDNMLILKVPWALCPKGANNSIKNYGYNYMLISP